MKSDGGKKPSESWVEYHGYVENLYKGTPMKNYEAETREIIAMMDAGELSDNYDIFPFDMPPKEVYKRRDAINKHNVMWMIRRALLKPIMEANPDMTAGEAIEKLKNGGITFRED